MRLLTLIIVVILALLGISFAALNATPVMLNYYIGSSQLPLSLLLVVAFACGGVLCLIISIIPFLKLKTKSKLLRRRLKLIEEEVTNLRAMPLKDEH